MDELVGDVKYLDVLRFFKRFIGYDDVVVGKEEDFIGIFYGFFVIFVNL